MTRQHVIYAVDVSRALPTVRTMPWKFVQLAPRCSTSAGT
jgi:hypothetical protein